MVVMPMQVNDTEYIVVLGLPPEGVARILNYDPACFAPAMLGDPWQQLRLKEVQIGHATQEDIATMQALIKQNRPGDAARVMVRNWAFRPDLGDHDGPLVDLAAEAFTQRH